MVKVNNPIVSKLIVKYVFINMFLVILYSEWQDTGSNRFTWSWESEAKICRTIQEPDKVTRTQKIYVT